MHEAGLQAWLDAGHHGEMDYMASHGMKRARPAELVPGTVRAITARMDYLPRATPDDWRARERLRQPIRGAPWSRCMRADAITTRCCATACSSWPSASAAEIGDYGYRVFTDSAPVMELPLAEKAGLGWRGKHTLLLSREAGSTFFIGEILVDLPLPVDAPTGAHCGQCSACIDVCPTQRHPRPRPARCAALHFLPDDRTEGQHPGRPAAPDRQPHLRLRRLPAGLPLEQVRPARDCCPISTSAMAWARRHGGMFGWEEEEFNRRMEGSPIRRIGHERWLRNLAVGLGNAADGRAGDAAYRGGAARARGHPSALVREHVAMGAGAPRLRA
jgi:epoxyqueuosine reductase